MYLGELIRLALICSRKVIFFLEMLPPTQDALKLHAARSSYQASIWLQSDRPILKIIPPGDTVGWKNDNGLEIIWTTLPSVPNACMELVSCMCKAKCKTARCQCARNKLRCMPACGCNAEECRNPEGIQHDDDDLVN